MERIGRRSFVATVSGAVVGLVTRAETVKLEAGKVPRIRLGRSRLDVPRMALGSTREVTRPVLAYCLQQGLNWVDTAPNYVQYRSEELLGKLFRTMGLARENLILSSKNKSRDPARWPRLVETSCKRLATDYLDIFYAHSIGGLTKNSLSDSTDWLLKPEVARAAAELKRSGRIRAFGYTCHVGDRKFVNELIRNTARAEHVDVLMVRYNFRDYGDSQFAESLAMAHEAGQGVVAMKTQSGAKATPAGLKPFIDKGFNHWQAAIRWAASNPSVHAVCANLVTLEAARENIAAIKQPQLSAAELERLMLYARATSSSACRACGACAAACPQTIAVPEINRALMYTDDYGDHQTALETYREIAAYMRADRCRGCGVCELACPHDLAIRDRMKRAASLFA